MLKRYVIATAYEQYWSDEPVLTVRIATADLEDWSTQNNEFWWSFAPIPTLWDRIKGWFTP